MPERLFLYVLFGSEWMNLNVYSPGLLAALVFFLALAVIGLHVLRIKRISSTVNVLKSQLAIEQMAQAAQTQIRIQTSEYLQWELHDNIGQILSLIKLKLASQSKEDVAESRQLLALAISEIRLLSKSLTNDYASEKSVINFVQAQLDMVKRRSHVKVTLLENTQFHPENIQARAILFWIVQECLKSIIRHAAVTEVAVNFLERGEAKLLEITANGAGFNGNKEFGSSGMDEVRQRAKMIGARVTWESQAGQGTKVVILL